MNGKNTHLVISIAFLHLKFKIAIEKKFNICPKITRLIQILKQLSPKDAGHFWTFVEMIGPEGTGVSQWLDRCFRRSIQSKDIKEFF